MQVLRIVLFVMLIVNEYYAASKLQGEVPQVSISWKIFAGISSLLCLIPLTTWVLPWNDIIGIVLITIQALLLIFEILGERQLGKDFTAGTVKPSIVQTNGLFSLFENPIYLCLIGQVFVWGIWNPMAWLLLIFLAKFMSVAVKSERMVIKPKRGIDSTFWDWLINLFA